MSQEEPVAEQQAVAQNYSDEVRRILHVTWQLGRRGRSAQHVVVTQLVERNNEIVDAEEECSYCINELLHDMIQAALPPYNGEREIVLAPPNI